MEFNTVTTAIAFLGLIGVGAAGMIGSNMMVTSTILTMVVPSMAVFGVIMLALGVKHGEYRAVN
ncbi:DUF7333 family protein [Natronocalculus amylovorans]|uniref:Uncharacterized protein n=1 Tax=Natronocalculus amylovorans TaxID=2917812 RepID=A0AAE3K7F0_9EURY|nr:hypothetical protein [Natronocalculus amylovorans]MCL9815380.1 hypothetical protein [Natronocalculus amylovorans]NUE02106.1 hypothetical protein [Halorubraceae archaeon YAN]